MTDDTKTGEPAGMPTPRGLAALDLVMGRAQQMLMQAWADSLDSSNGPAVAGWRMPGMASPARSASACRRSAAWRPADPMALMTAGAQAWAKGLEAWGKMLGRRPRPKAEAQGSPLRRARMARKPAVRHHPPDLSRACRPDARVGRRDRRTSTRRPAKAEVRDQELRRRDEPVQFRADQPAGAQADDRDPRRESAQGPRQHAQGHRRRADDAEPSRARSRSAATSRRPRARSFTRRRCIS